MIKLNIGLLHYTTTSLVRLSHCLLSKAFLFQSAADSESPCVPRIDDRSSGAGGQAVTITSLAYGAHEESKYPLFLQPTTSSPPICKWTQGEYSTPPKTWAQYFFLPREKVMTLADCVSLSHCTNSQIFFDCCHFHKRTNTCWCKSTCASARLIVWVHRSL